jgi:acetyl esterase/lipase
VVIMALSYDPEIAVAVEAALAAASGLVLPPRGDALGLRAAFEPFMAESEAHASVSGSVSRMPCATASADGATINLYWYSRGGERPGSAAVYLHGGGTICGTVGLYHSVIAGYVAATGVPLLAVDYRRPPESPHPGPVEDCYAGLRWLRDHAGELGVDPARIAVMGDSAGGLLSAAVALLARDRGLPLARQILIYPMLDDRTVVADEALLPFALWSYDFNYTAWRALLGPAFGTDDVPPAAAPARATDLAGLPPAYVEVGELDIFRDEDIDYARRLAAAGISVELHVHPGAPHSFERVAPESAVAQRAMADRYRILASL